MNETMITELGPRVAVAMGRENLGLRRGRQLQIVMRWYMQFKR